jgi:uncharacterized SAM-binding protein YcdF (DUF218 family)
LPSLPPPRPLRQQRPVHRRRRRRVPVSTPKRNWRRIGILSAIGVAGILTGWALLARVFAGKSNTNLARFDAIIVLGHPADSDGNPTPLQQATVTEAVREYMRGTASRIIFTGGAAHNQFVEAEVMARVAESEGIPASAIFVEPKAQDTIQNACYSERIMRERRWASAEIIAPSFQAPRAAMIVGKLPIKWRMRVAPPVGPVSPLLSAWRSGMETLKTVRYLIYAQWADRCDP